MLEHLQKYKAWGSKLEKQTKKEKKRQFLMAIRLGKDTQINKLIIAGYCDESYNEMHR